MQLLFFLRRILIARKAEVPGLFAAVCFRKIRVDFAIHVGCLPSRFTVIRMPSSAPRASISFQHPWSWSVVWVDLLILEVFDSRRCSWCASLKCPLKSVFLGMIPQASATTSDSWDGYFKCCISLDHLYRNICDFAIFCWVFQDWQQGIIFANSRLDPMQVCFWSFWRHRDAMLLNTLPSLRKWRPTPTVG